MPVSNIVDINLKDYNFCKNKFKNNQVHNIILIYNKPVL